MERAVQGQRLRGSAGGSTVSAATAAECATACANSDCNVYEFSNTGICNIYINMPIVGFVEDNAYNITTRGRCVNRLIDVTYL